MTDTARKSVNADSINSQTETRPSTDLISKNKLWARLRRGLQERVRFVDSHLSKGLAFQIRAMRDEKEWSQEELAERVGMNQNAISRLENPNYGKPTLTTLKRIATVFDVALVVRFVPFSQLIDWVNGIPFVDPGLSSESLAVPSFDEDIFTNRTAGIESFAEMNLQQVPINTQGYLTVGPGFLSNLDSRYTNVIYGGENFALATAAYTPIPTLKKTPDIPVELIPPPMVEHFAAASYKEAINV